MAIQLVPEFHHNQFWKYQFGPFKIDLLQLHDTNSK